jgi:RHS repeat-associated protein
MLQQHEHTRHPASFPSRHNRPRRDCYEGSRSRRGLHAARRHPRRGSDCRKSLLTPGSDRVKKPDHGGPLFYGQYTSTDTGLIYMRARVYDPATAQFLTVDPFVGVTRAPYNYGADNPLNNEDPTGLSSTAEGLSEGGIPCFPPFCGPPPGAAEAISHGIESAWNAVNENEGPNDEGEADLHEKETARENCGEISPNFDDPGESPGPGWKWHGNPDAPVGSDEGAWVNDETGETLHPDLNHPEPQGPHFDYKAPDGSEYRIYPDGRIEPKLP